MRVLAVGFAALLMTGLSVASATDTPPPPPEPVTAPAQPAVDPEQAKKDAHDNEIICRTEDETGTRLRKTKICMTRKEWRTGEQASQDAISAVQKKGATSGMAGN